MEYEHIAKAYGLDYFIIERTSELKETMAKIISSNYPTITNVMVLPEDQLLPPVPEWKHVSNDKKIQYLG